MLMRDERDDQDIIVVEDESLRLGFTQIPNTLLRRPDVSPGAKLTYMGLLSYAWQQGSCFPGQETLADDLGIGKRSVVRHLQELRDVGLLLVKRRGLGKTNVYVLPRVVPSFPQGRREGTTRSAKMALQEMPKSTHLEVPNRHTKNTQREEDPDEENEDHISKGKHKGNLHKIKADPQRYAKLRLRTNREASRARASSDADTLGVAPASTGMAKLADVLAERDLLRAASAERSGTHRGRPPKAPDYLAATMADLSQKLHDDNPRSSVSQATRLWKASGLPEDKFVHRLHEAKSITQQQGSVKGKPAKADRQLVNRMPYFFAVVEDLVGLKGEEQP